jgi:hypothetical protein
MGDRYKYPLPWAPIVGDESEDNLISIRRAQEWFVRTWPEHATDSYDEIFPEAGRKELLDRIIPPVSLAAFKCTRPLLKNRLAPLTDSQNFWNTLGINPRETSYVIHFAESVAYLDLYVKASTLFYAVSTFLVPSFVEMGELISFLSDFRSSRSEESLELANSWYLVVLYPFMQCRMAKMMEGDLVSFFERRRRSGRFTVFVDLADDEIGPIPTPGTTRKTIKAPSQIGRFGRLLSDRTVLVTD